MSDKSVDLQEFMAHAVTVQSFERVAQQSPGWGGLDVVQRQAVNVALDAIARVLHGDAQNSGVWTCGGAALTLAGEFVTFTPADTVPMRVRQEYQAMAAEMDAKGGWCAAPVVGAPFWAVHRTLSDETREVYGSMTGARMFEDRAAAQSKADELNAQQPDADGWIEWIGGECPVGAGVKVAVRLHDGREPPHALGEHWDWSHLPAKDSHACGNIVAYRVVK